MISQPTFALDATGDSYLDSSGNITIITGVESVSQTVANALQLWLGEYQFNTTIGVPWYNILGERFNRLLVNTYVEQEVLALPYVASIVSIDYIFNDKERSVIINLVFLTTDSKNSQEVKVVI
jgi:hypothetical protein